MYLYLSTLSNWHAFAQYYQQSMNAIGREIILGNMPSVSTLLLSGSHPQVSQHFLLITNSLTWNINNVWFFVFDFRLLTPNLKKSPTDPVDTEVVATGADGEAVATAVVVSKEEKTMEHQDNTCALTAVDSKATVTPKVRTFFQNRFQVY